MKTRVELVANLEQDEVVLQCAAITPRIQRLLDLLQESDATLEAEVDGGVVFLSLGDVLFIETDGDAVFAHTTTSFHRVRRRLYQLEAALPPSFVRVSKSTIVHVRHIATISHGAVSERIDFRNTQKSVYVSRRYRKSLQDKMRALLGLGLS